MDIEIYSNSTNPAAEEFKNLLKNQFTKTKNSILINTSNLSKRACFLKTKTIIDRKINI